MRQKKRIIGSLTGLSLLLGTLVIVLGSQKPSSPTDPPAVATSQSNAQALLTNQNVIRVEVPIVTVDVVVTDKKGKPVKGLTKSDFKILEDGTPQDILNFSYFSEEEGGEELASITTDPGVLPERQNYVLFLFDNTTMDPSSQERARRSAAKFIDENLRPGDYAAIANYRNSMQIIQNFSSNKRRLAQALGVITGVQANEPGDSVGNPAANPLQSQAQQTLKSLSGSFDARNLMIAMRGLFNSLRNVKGRKSLIVFSAGLTLSNDNSIDLYSAIDAANKANVTVYTIDAKGLSVEVPANIPGRRRISENRPNGSGTSLDLFVNSFQGTRGGDGPRGGGSGGSTGGGRPGGGFPGGSGGGGSPGGAGGGGNPGGNPGGLPGGNPGGTRGDNNPYDPYNTNRDPYGNRNTLDRPLDQLTLNELKDVLLTMATETGGFYIRNSNDFNRGLQDIKSEMRNYYSLGYESNKKTHDGKFRTIKVEVEKKGAHAKYRKGYFDQKPLDALAGTVAEKPLNKAIAATAPLNGLPLKLVCDYFYEGPDQVRAPVTIQLPIAKLKFRKEKNLRADAIDVLGVALREDGSQAARFSDTLNFRIENERLKKLPENATLSIPNYFKLPPGKYRLKIAVRDEGDVVSTAEQPVDIPRHKPGEFAVSSLVLSSEVRELSSLLSNLESQLFDDTNPLIYNGLKVYQSVGKRFSQDLPMALYFMAYNLASDAKDKKPAVQLSYSIMTRNKLVYQLPLSQIKDPVVQDGRMALGMWIPLKDIPPGDYTVQLMVRDAVTNATKYLRNDFVVEALPAK